MQRTPEPEYMDMEEEAAAYDDADFSDVNAAFVAAVIDFAPSGTPLRVLDLGCGPGDIPLRLHRERTEWRIVGADASRAMLRRAQHKKPNTMPYPAYVLCDAKCLPLPSAAVDYVISNSILHHVADAHTFWSEIRRVAKGKGSVFLRDLCRPESEEAAAGIVHEYAGNESPLLQEEFYRSLLAAYTVGELRGQLEAAGISGLQVKQVTDRHLDAWGVIG